MPKRFPFYYSIVFIVLALFIYYFMSERIYDLCCQPGRTFKVTTSTFLENIVINSESTELTYARNKDVFVSDYRKSLGKTEIRNLNVVTLVTQTHVENLHLLDTLAKRWSGPISIAIFIDKFDDDLIQKVRFYHECFPHIRENSTFHLLSPPGLKTKSVDIDCTQVRRFTSTNHEGIHVLQGLDYPHNLLRNLAMPDEEGRFVFHIDIDMVPSWNLHDYFLNFSSSLKSSLFISSIFIIPAFESKDFDVVPGTKQELLDGLQSGSVQSYHNQSCPHCQIDTDFNKWLTLPPDIRCYKVVRTYCAYEPFFIMSRVRHIMFDERFKGRGYDRISQVSEVWLAGFTFYVLGGSFVVHRGFHPAPPTTPPPTFSNFSTPITSPPTTLPQSVYDQMHWDFLRAKYLSNDKIRGRIKAKYSNARIQSIEERLSLQNYTEEEKRNESKKIDWLRYLDGDEEMQYKLYMKYGEEGYVETTTPNVTTTTTLTYTKEAPNTEDPIDPHKFMFMQFLIEKWKIYNLDSRKQCLF